jgi:hypothetical protein
MRFSNAARQIVAMVCLGVALSLGVDRPTSAQSGCGEYECPALLPYEGCWYGNECTPLSGVACLCEQNGDCTLAPHEACS